jgi:hypothetical protein
MAVDRGAISARGNFFGPIGHLSPEVDHLLHVARLAPAGSAESRTG